MRNATLLSRLPMTLFLLALLALPASALDLFKGSVTFDIQAGRDTMQMALATNGKQMRIDPKGKGMAGMGGIILDWPSQSMMVLMTEQRMFMRMDLQDDALEAYEDEAGSTEDMEVEKTGETEKIAGVLAEQIKILNKRTGEETEAWVSDELGSMMPMGMAMGGNPMKGKGETAKWWEKALGSEGFFPLRIVSRNDRGDVVMRMEAIDIDRDAPPASAFAPPAGYREFNMPNIPGMENMFGR